MPIPPVYPLAPSSLGYGGSSYAYTPYGSGLFPRPPVAVTGGYGGSEYGLSSYGSLDVLPPRVSSVLSLDGSRVEVFFSEEMLDDADLIDPSNYVFTSVLGAPVTALSVLPSIPGTLGGYTSVVVTHSGSTLGGTYTLTASNLRDMAGNVILSFPVSFFSLGDGATFTVTATSGSEVEFQFSRGLVSEGVFSPGVEDLSHYILTTTYPIPIVTVAATQTTPSTVALTVTQMTSATYDVEVGPALSFDYQGATLPDVDPTFTGVEIGTGTSTASVATRLRMSKAVAVLYGWAFEDTSGRVLPASSIRMDFTFDPSTATYTPVLQDLDLGIVSFSDGAIQVDVTFTRVVGVDTIVVTSGIYSRSIPVLWSTGSTTITLLRNQLADSYSLLVNGVPLMSEATASLTGVPSINPGVQFLLTANYDVSDLKVSALRLTSSQTLFTTAWNFLHELSGSFVGSSLLANDRILTKRGPLVKDWGDATPATKADVAVRVNGTDVDVGSVNPYTGTIYPTIPIPRTPPGTVAVEVDYSWFPAPVMDLVGLNTPGLILNKWDLPRGHTFGAVSGTRGVADTARFPMGVVLPGGERTRPVWIGHRYMGFEREYSALLNNPKLLLLNQDPNRVSTPGLESSCEGFKVSFDGFQTPVEASWVLLGADAGSLQSDGTYLVDDASSGDVATGTATVYYREEAMDCAGDVSLVGRLRVGTWQSDGVFTGVGFGFTDNRRLYFVGFLEINGLKHLGFLKDARLPHLVDSWEVGPAVTITITSSTTFTVDASAWFSLVQAGAQFQILSGLQAGIYLIRECGVDTYQGVVTVTLDATTPFPVSPTRYGADTATAVFEVEWDAAEAATYRLVAGVGETYSERDARVYVGGSLSGLALSVSGSSITAIPGDTSLLVPTGDTGRVLFGSLSRLATSQSYWSLCRGSFTPDALLHTIPGLVVEADMTLGPPEDAVNHPWAFTNRFGYSEIDGANRLLLKSTSESDVLDFTFGYGRLEPALTKKVFADTDAVFQVDSGVLGAGGAIIRVRDNAREARLATLLYVENLGVSKALVSLPVLSLSGTMTPVEQGWLVESGSQLPVLVSEERHFEAVRLATDVGFWVTNLTLNMWATGSRLLEARLAIKASVAGAGGQVGPTWGVNTGAPGNAYAVRVTLRASPARVVFTNAVGAELASFPFDWTDGLYHTYRVEADPVAGTAILTVDDVVLGFSALNVFDLAVNDTGVRLGFQGGGTCTVWWDSFSAVAMPLATLKRTLGVYVGGDLDSIDSYAIPRTDTWDVPNSDPLSTIQEMDWRAPIQVRVHLDQQWGVTVLRPDLPAPPWWVAPGDFATQITDPTAAWISVEYKNLPRHVDGVGSIAFGSLDPRSVTQQRWSDFRYRLYNQSSGSTLAPHAMVLNRYNIITSGEYLYDTTPEVVTIASLTSTTLSIRSAHMNADRVFVVQVDGAVVPSTTWTFNSETQILTLTNALPSSSYPVTVTFAPGKPITNTYLCGQPFTGSVTKLNIGTPPFPLSQDEATIRSIVPGTVVTDPSQPSNPTPDEIDNTPYDTVEFTDPADALYAGLEVCTVEDGGDTQAGLISTLCDGPAPESGLIAIELSGSAYHDAFIIPGGLAQTKGSPVIAGSAAAFSQASILCASGGSKITGGNLGPGTAILYPCWPGPNGRSRDAELDRRGVNQEMHITLTTTIPYEEDVPPPGDNVPPSLVEGGLNPDGTPGVKLHGACAARIVEYAADGVSRAGPWSGLQALSIGSLLGGGAKITSSTFLLNGGNHLTPPVVTDFQVEAAN